MEASSIWVRNMEVKRAVREKRGITMNTLPKDPAMLLSVINTKLRDYYPDLGALCEDLGADETAVIAALKGIDYEYDAGRNQFV